MTFEPRSWPKVAVLTGFCPKMARSLVKEPRYPQPVICSCSSFRSRELRNPKPMSSLLQRPTMLPMRPSHRKVEYIIHSKVRETLVMQFCASTLVRAHAPPVVFSKACVNKCIRVEYLMRAASERNEDLSWAITNTILGVPYYLYSIMGPKTLY